jgi:PAS domain S-box-containing protein
MMRADWKWDKLDSPERLIAELLIQGKSNAAIGSEVFLSRARVQEYIKRILIKTGTESTRAAIALLVEERENMSLLRILDQASDGVVIIQDRVIEFANQAVHRSLGYDPYQLRGIPMIERLAPRSRDFVTSQYDLRLGGEPFLQSYEIRILCKDGQEKDVLVNSAGLIRFRGRVAVLGIVIEQA